MHFTGEKIAEIQDRFRELGGSRDVRLTDGWHPGVAKGIMVVCNLDELDKFIKDLQTMQKAIREVAGVIC